MCAAKQLTLRPRCCLPGPQARLLGARRQDNAPSLSSTVLPCPAKLLQVVVTDIQPKEQMEEGVVARIKESMGAGHGGGGGGKGSGSGVLALQCDVRDRKSVDEAVKAAAEHFGGVNIMVANAGRWLRRAVSWKWLCGGRK